MSLYVSGATAQCKLDKAKLITVTSVYLHASHFIDADPYGN